MEEEKKEIREMSQNGKRVHPASAFVNTPSSFLKRIERAISTAQLTNSHSLWRKETDTRKKFTKGENTHGNYEGRESHWELAPGCRRR